MNLHGLVSGAIATVNPFDTMQVLVSSGSTTLASGKRVPAYADPVTMLGQVQALSAGELRQLDGINIQGVRRKIYLDGQVDGIVRVQEKGGDLVKPLTGLFAGRTFLVVLVLEYWPDWCSLATVLQDDH